MSRSSSMPLGRIAVMICLAVSVLLAACGCSSASASSSATTQAADAGTSSKVQVVASFYPMADFAQRIGGDKVNVTCMVPAGTEPHDWEPSAADIQTIDSADLLVYNGAGMESWVSDVLTSAGSDAPASVCASDGITLRQVTADEGDEAGQLVDDPHVWNSPKDAKAEMRNIADALEKADPADADTFEANYATAAAEADQLDQEYASTLSACTNNRIVVSHEAWGYLCDEYGLTQVGIEGLDPDAEPDAQAMAAITDEVRQDGITTIFYEDLVSPKVAQAIASETGATAEQLNPLEGLTDEELAQGQDYFSVMRSNLSELKAALA